ncbi:pilus assembly protein TadB [Vibrio diazotrophicus]|uniref:Pilus assembly protein TadB n=1 Tax=Vibrio diazotrophicus TaxID=685 RepID=A0A2J8I4W5_VIBDI|nr:MULTISPECIES: type II secretion system F family protein [Vibrio]MCF7361907.1 type II secretion system F family protein [Vibrio sp. A1-b2]PNI05549.1 pilus assembly protein TadB [Vibrio diazotrophicus]
MIFLIALFWILLIVYWIVVRKRESEIFDQLLDGSLAKSDTVGIERNAIDIKYFEHSYLYSIKIAIKSIVMILQPNMFKKLLAFFILTSVVLYLINDIFFRKDFIYSWLVVEPFLFLMLVLKLKKYRQERFKNHFPDALNILSGAMSSGQSIVHGFGYVGKQLDNEVGHEFKRMADRLLIGEDAGDVLERSCANFPYLEYFFFISAIRINLHRGGQLKEVIKQIGRLMFVSRAVEKKKLALTSEARSSAKILAFLPLFFLLIMRFLTPENYDFVIHEEGGKIIFYYVVFSEFIGFFCIWLILRGVK